MYDLFSCYLAELPFKHWDKIFGVSSNKLLTLVCWNFDVFPLAELV